MMVTMPHSYNHEITCSLTYHNNLEYAWLRKFHSPSMCQISYIDEECNLRQHTVWWRV